MIIKFLSAILKLHFYLWHFPKCVASGNYLSVFVSSAEKLFQNIVYQHFSGHFHKRNILADSFTGDKLAYAESRKGSPGLYETSGKILTFPGRNRFSYSKLRFPVVKPVLGEISANKLRKNCCGLLADSITGKIKSGSKKNGYINKNILHYPDHMTNGSQKAATRSVSLPEVQNESFASYNLYIALIYKLITNQLTYLIKWHEHALATTRIFFFIIVRPKCTESG